MSSQKKYIKAHISDEFKLKIDEALTLSGMNQSEFVRQAVWVHCLNFGSFIEFEKLMPTPGGDRYKNES